MQYLMLTCRMALAGVFLLALAGKLRNKGGFRSLTAFVSKLPLVPSRLAPLLAGGALAVEGGIVALLAYAPTAALGFLVGAATLVIFTIALIAAWRSGSDLSCQCFGTSTSVVGPAQIGRNAVLVAIAGTGLMSSVLDDLGPTRAGGVAVALAAGVVIAVVVQLFDDLLAIISPRPRRSITGR